MLPHQLACKAGALLVCHDPMKMAGHLGAAPSELSFGDSVAQAGARPVRIRCDPSARHNGGRPQGTKIKGPEAFAPPARAISIKNKHLLVIYSIPARGFTAAVSVFIGTPPPKPLNCKSVSNHCGALLSDLWADPTGEEFCILCAIFSFVLRDIIETSF